MKLSKGKLNIILPLQFMFALKYVVHVFIFASLRRCLLFCSCKAYGPCSISHNIGVRFADSSKHNNYRRRSTFSLSEVAERSQILFGKAYCFLIMFE